MECRRCGASNPGDARLCVNCGEPLTAPGAELLGPPLDYTPPHIATRILEGREAMQGERKHVTVLFCDVVDSTRLAEDLGPEAMHALLRRFFRTALEHVHRYEGTVNQFLGDGFMAIFGAPIAHQDHAARAALAAIGLREAVQADRSRTPVAGTDRLHLRMGLNSGLVVVGGIGDDLRMDYTAVGDTTNLAARLQAAAAHDEILLGGTTARSGGEALLTEELEPLRVKGKDHRIGAFRLLGALPFTARVASRRTDFVGRRKEMTSLTAAFHAARQGIGSIVDIEGEPGVGKSRLVLEFTTSLGGDARIVRGRCVSYGSQLPNVPIADLVRDACGVPATEKPAAALPRLLSSVEGDAEAADFLGALIGVPASLERVREVDAATVRGRTSQALRRLLGARGGQPLIAIVEDLHWADASSLDFLSEIASIIPAASVSLVATYRPGSSPPWESRSDVSKIQLHPLGLAESERIVRGLPESSSMSADQVQLVLDRGEGNPFFLEELTRAVAHGSVSAVPDDVHDVIAARIDRLDERNRDVLRTAAVIGREFDEELLAAATGMNGQLPTALERLGALGFVERASEGRHVFVHALTQDVAYGSMLTTQRQSLHSAVASLLRDRFISAPEQACEEIARHLLLGSDPHEAIPFLELANEKAMRTHAMEEASGFFETALELLESEEPTAENVTHRVKLLTAEWTAYHFMHRHDEYAALIERYAPIAEGAEALEAQGPYLVQRGHRFWVLARYAESRKLLEAGLSRCRQVGDAVNEAHALMVLQWLFVWTGDYDEADRHGHAALKAVEKAPTSLFRTLAPSGLSLSSGCRGRWAEAIEWAARAHEVGFEIGDDGMASFASAMQSLAHVQQGDVDAAIAAGQRSIAVAPTVYFRGWGQAFTAAAMCRTDQVHPGVDILQGIADFIKSSQHVSGYLVVGLLLAEGWLLAGDFDRSRTVATELGTLAYRAGVPFIHAGSETLLGEIALARGSVDEASMKFRGAIEEFGIIGAENGRAQGLSGLGRAALASDDEETARPLLAEALATFERLGTRGAPDVVRAALSSIS